MKMRTCKKPAAVLLALALLMSLLPSAALAGELEEEPAATPYSTEIPNDGAGDTWTQEASSVVGTADAVAELTAEGKLRLAAGSQNEYDWTGGKKYPSMFTSANLDAALAAAGDGEKTFAMTFTPKGSPMCFGVALNYTKVDQNVLIGYSFHKGGWFIALNTGESSTDIPLAGIQIPGVGTTYELEVHWTDDELTALWIDGKEVQFNQAGDTSIDISSVPAADSLALMTGNWHNATELICSDIHYTGQATTTAWDVSGVVTDSVTDEPVEGAAITLGSETVKTDARGAYKVPGLQDGTYSLTVSMEGYWSPEAVDVEISGADITKDLELEAYTYSDVSGKVTDGETGAPVSGVKVVGGGVSAATDADGAYTLPRLLAGEYTLTFTKDGYRSGSREVAIPRGSGPLTGQDAELTTASIATLSTPEMDVKVDLEFPRVIQYEMNGKIIYGQSEELDTIIINKSNPGNDSVLGEGEAVRPKVTAEQTSGSEVTYKMEVNGEDGTHAVITAVLSVEKNVLTFAVTDVAYPDGDRIEHPLQSIEIPHHSLVSVNSTQEGAAFAGTRGSGNTVTRRDTYIDVNDEMNLSSDAFSLGVGKGSFYAFVSADGLSAGIASNSTVGYDVATRDNYRILADASESADGVKSVGLRSALWYYDRDVASCIETTPDSSAWVRNPYAVENLTAEERIIGPSEEEMPYVRVVITEDRNGDGVTDWKDGVIAARDDGVIHKPFKSEEVPELISTRIALNFGSQAQNPFLTTLDNVKRVALHTDGLGQAVLLKGYASEGHDSGHPDFYDIGERMGGPEDMNTMMEEGREYGARFGIHINTSEFYPEADAFDDPMLRIMSDGSMKWGWEWLDQGVGINGVYDLATGNREERLAKLKELVGDNMDFVYTDVWGNRTSGAEDAWQTSKLSNMLRDNGWRMVQEWCYANEPETTFSHWISDYTYGNYTYKGYYNSDIYRMLFNSTKDVFAPDYSHLGGSANAPLLGGAVMQGFEGWQKDGEYDEHIEATFEHLIPGKFLQHFDIMDWIDSETSVTMPYATDYNKGQSDTQWIPEVRIELEDEKWGDVVVTRGTDPDEAATKAFVYGGGTDSDKQEYRSRVITLNGKVILTGAAVPATPVSGQAMAGSSDRDTNTLRGLANQKYLIPWFWDNEGGDLALADQKLYHRNDLGGESTWELPDSWANVTSVKVYKLTDTGRVNERTVNVANHQVTLTAEPKVPYVVVPGNTAAAGPQVEWSTHMHLADVSFNSAAITDHWTVTGSGTAERFATERQVPMLKLTGEVAVSQEMTDLVPGQDYAVYVGVDNRSTDAKAFVSVKVDGETVDANYTEQSIARNHISGYTHHYKMPVEDNTSNFQNMYVYFTAPAQGVPVTLELSRGAGTGNTYFDDVRVVEDSARNVTKDSLGRVIKFEQDFENVVQGEYPFVVGPVENVEDNRQHLAKRHEPYTQKGWEGKVMDDVIDGDWSLKVNGGGMYPGYSYIYSYLVFQSVPQNFRFEPGVEYTVEFDYEMGSDHFVLVKGDGAYDYAHDAAAKGELTRYELKDTSWYPKNAPSEHFRGTITGDESGQTWIGLLITDSWNFYYNGGTNTDTGNFTMDNLVITRNISPEKLALDQVIQRAMAMDLTEYPAAAAALENARTIYADESASAASVTGATASLEAAIANVTYGVTIVEVGNGTVSIDPASAKMGTEMTLTITPDSGYKLDTITAVKTGGGKAVALTGTGSTRTFLMPGFNTTVTATLISTGGSSGGGSTGGGSTATETTKNPDGSTTKTVTDKKTGEVTATTTYPDGTKIVTTTPKDGASVSVVTVPKNKDSVTVTIPTDRKPAPGEVAVIVNPDGTTEVVKTCVATDDGMRITLSKNATVKIIDNSKRFMDVAEGYWAAGAVKFAASRELFHGTSASTFSPTENMTRGMLMTVLARLAGQDTAAGETWYSAGMAWAVEQGISDGSAREADMTRESLVVMLYRYAKAEAADGASLSAFPDAGKVSDWAVEAMSWAVHSGILTGNGAGELNPTGTASRAEVAAILMRFVEQPAK